MTVATTGNKFSYAGDGATKTFPFPRPFFGNAGIRVILVDADGTETVQNLSADYSVEGGLEVLSAGWLTATAHAVDDTVKHGGVFYICTAAHTSGPGTEPGVGGSWTTVWALVPEENGGQINMVTAPALGETLVVVRRTGKTQETEYVTGGAFTAKGHETALDKLTLITQDLQEQIDRAPRMSESSLSSTPVVPEPSGLKYLRWNSDGSDLENAAAVQWLSGVGAPSDPATGSDGDMYLRTDTAEVYGPKSAGAWGLPVADLTGPQGSGDMQSAVYDPGGVSMDAFAMDNMVEGAATKVLTDVERSKLASVETGADVTDSATVEGAGAVMTSGVQTISGEKTFSSAVRMEAGARVVSPTTFSDVVIGAPVGNNAGLVLADEAQVKRWVILKDGSAESGSNVGSDFSIRRFDDAGAALGIAFSLARSSGIATFISDVSVGGNIAMGSGGPIIATGSGSPENSISASVGSVYLRTNGGANSSMYVKESGVGNTGWVAK